MTRPGKREHPELDRDYEQGAIVGSVSGVPVGLEPGPASQSGEATTAGSLRLAGVLVHERGIEPSAAAVRRAIHRIASSKNLNLFCWLACKPQTAKDGAIKDRCLSLPAIS